jgi:hypothetical protein
MDDERAKQNLAAVFLPPQCAWPTRQPNTRKNQFSLGLAPALGTNFKKRGGADGKKWLDLGNLNKGVQL